MAQIRTATHTLAGFSGIPLLATTSAWKCFMSAKRCHRVVHAAPMSRAQTTSADTTPGMPLPAADKITSTDNAYIKHCVKLRDNAKYRQQHGRLLLAGVVPITEIAGANTPLDVQVAFVPLARECPGFVKPKVIVYVSEPVLKKLAGVESAESIGLVVEMSFPQPVDLTRVACERLLVLDGVQDPGNLGTLLRTALAFGWDAAFLLPGCCDPFNSKALRASRGAALRMPLEAGSWERLQQVVDAHGLKLLAGQQQGTGEELAVPQRQQHSSSNVPSGMPPVALVLGSEGQGLSETALQHCTPVAVPMVGHMESLNVGVAGAILMFVLSRGLPAMTRRLEDLQLKDE